MHRRIEVIEREDNNTGNASLGENLYQPIVLGNGTSYMAEI
jgi:hypothetical protein